MKTMIHQTWKTATPEDRFPAEWMNSWRSLNPDWGYRLWTDEDIHDHVRVNHAGFFPVWCSYPLQIMRVDAWRFLLLKEQGGLYVDLDFICLRPLNEWLLSSDRLFACADQGNGILCNAFMWAPDPASPFLEGIEEAMVQNAYQPDAVEAAGPHFLKRYGADRSHLMHEIESSQVYPLKYWESDRLDAAARLDAEQLRRHFPEAGALSFWTGTWIGQDLSLASTPREGGAP